MLMDEESDTQSGPPYANQLQLPAAGQTYEPLEMRATPEQVQEYDHAAALASLANTGMMVQSFEHELIRDMWAMEQVSKELRAGNMTPEEAADKIDALHERMTESRRFLSGPMSPDFGAGTRNSAMEAKRWSPGRMVQAAKKDLAFFVGKRGAKVTWEADEHLMLPPASYVEWLTVLQNAFVNATGAIARQHWDNWGPDSEPGRIHVEFRRNEGAPPTILIHDNGIGIDLEKAPSYFKPFQRGTRPGDSDTGSRFGGYGLGLSIVQMLSRRHGMEASFIEPSEGWSTTLRIGPAFDRPEPKSLEGVVNYSDREIEELLVYGSPHSVRMFVEASLRSCASRSEEEFRMSMGELLWRFRELSRSNPDIKAIIADQRERLDERHAENAAKAAAAEAEAAQS